MCISYLYGMQMGCTGRKEKEVEQKENGSPWIRVVHNSHSCIDRLSYSKVKDTVITCALPICLCL